MKQTSMDVFSSEQLEKLKHHRYHAEGTSLLEPLFQPFWKYSASKLPRWLSPNIVTLAGVLSILVPSSLLVYHTHQGSSEYVPILSLFCSLGFILWLHLDSIDGKLARLNRPNQGSPFGELLDHGGDAITVLVASMALACQIGLQNVPYLMLVWILVNMCTNYVSEPWTIYLIGTMQFQSLDFVEILLVMSTMSFITGVWGVAVWQTVLTKYVNLRLWHLVFGVQMLVLPDLLIGKLPSFYALRKVNGMGLADIFGPGVPLCVLLASVLTSYSFSSPEFINENIIPFVLCFGLTLTKLHVQFILAHMMKEKFKPLDYCLAFPVTLALGIFILHAPASEGSCLFIMLSLVAVDTGFYFVRLFYQLYYVFNERIFVLPQALTDKNRNGELHVASGHNRN